MPLRFSLSFAILTAVCAGPAVAAAPASSLPAGCKIAGETNSGQEFKDAPHGMHYAAIVSCKERTDVYFTREARPKEKPDFLSPGSSDASNEQGRIILKKQSINPPPATVLLEEGTEYFCDRSDELIQKGDHVRIFIAIDRKKQILREYYLIDFNSNALEKHDGGNSKCRENENY